MPFAQLGLSQPILRALAKEGYETPTPIQAQCIPHVLEGKDVLGCAQTGTGKTAAFALPIIQRLMDMPIDRSRRGPAKARALILSPTRELALQIRDSFSVYGSESGLRSTVIFGGVSQLRQVQALRDGVDIIIATPGRLIDLMDQRKAHLDEVKILVLDEADRMLDMGFIQPIRLIASKTPPDRQTLFFSATMPPEIRKLADSLLKDPVSVAVNPVASAAPKIEQSLYHVDRAQKQALLTLLLGDRAMSRVVVFTKTKHGAEKVGRKLQFAGVRAETIHGNKAQNARKKALDLFRAGKARVLVATDVAARGLDVDGISHVINFDLPMEPEAYVHRIGRTGRAGATGVAISFCDREEKGLLKGIERLIKNRIATTVLPSVEGIQQELRVSDAREYAAREQDGFNPNGPGERTFESKPRGERSFQPRDARSGARPGPRSGHGSPSHGSSNKSRDRFAERTNRDRNAGPFDGSSKGGPRAPGKATAHTYNTSNVTHTVSYDPPASDAGEAFSTPPAKRHTTPASGHVPRHNAGTPTHTSRPAKPGPGHSKPPHKGAYKGGPTGGKPGSRSVGAGAPSGGQRGERAGGYGSGQGGNGGGYGGPRKSGPNAGGQSRAFNTQGGGGRGGNSRGGKPNGPRRSA
ncbi:MAG: DEAD/DEAH box helicase [Phycisphaeraceae bacterium]|nr:DEAD/DEAH box helicase [Phycisphaeraceae bacterium]MBX3366354.1 DEAD/DEAH box helicase [Phycisphaeraceae bacterium]